jgi:hypothetical protein
MTSSQKFYIINLFQVTLVHTVTIMLRILGLSCRDCTPAATVKAAAILIQQLQLVEQQLLVEQLLLVDSCYWYSSCN